LILNENEKISNRIETIKNKNGACIADLLAEVDYIGLISTSVFVNDIVFEKHISNDFSI
jgi:hypothetical protein